MTLTPAQWAKAMVALWACVIANWLLLDGAAYLAVRTFLVVGFLALLIDRTRNLKGHR